MTLNEKSKIRLETAINNLQLTQVKENPEVSNGLMKFINSFFYGDEDKVYFDDNNDDVIDEVEEEQKLLKLLIKFKVRSVVMDQFVEKYNNEKQQLLAKMTASAEFKNSSILDKESLTRGILDTFHKKIEKQTSLSCHFTYYVSSSSPPLEVMTDQKLNDLHSLHSTLGSELLRLLYNFYTYQYHSIPISVARIYDGTAYYPEAIKYSKKGILKQGVIENYADALELLKKQEIAKIAKEIDVKIKSSLKKEEMIKIIFDHPKIPETIFNYLPQREIFTLDDSSGLNKEKMMEIIQFRKYFEMMVREIKEISQNDY